MFTSPHRPDRIETHDASYPMGIGDIFFGVKSGEREAQQSPAITSN
jgi:hypothetical protein